MTSAKRLCLLALLLLCLMVAWGGRAYLGKAAFNHLLLPTIQRQLPGVQIQFQSLETNLISHLQLNGVSIDVCQGADCLQLHVPRLTLTYSIADLLPWPGANVVLSRTALNLQGASLSGAFTSSTSPFTPSALLLPALTALPAINARECSVDLKIDGVTIRGQGMTVRAPAFDPRGPGSLEVKLTADTLAVSGGAWPDQQGSLAATLSYQPGRLQMPSLFFRDALLVDNAVLESDNESLRFSMRLHLLQSQGQLQASMTREALALTFHLDEGNLTEFAKAADEEAPISGHLQADGMVTMPFDTPENLTASVTAKVTDGSWNGVPLDMLEISAQAADQRLSIDRLQLMIGPNRLTIKTAALPIPPLRDKAWLPLLAASHAEAQIHLTAPTILPPRWSAPFLNDWQALGLEVATADVTLRDGHLLLPRAEISGEAGRILVKDGNMDLSGELTAWQEIPCSFDWQAELSDAAVIGHFYEDWPTTGGKVQGSGSYAGTLAQPHLSLAATFQGASLYGVSLNRVTGTAEWNKGHLALDLTANNRDRDQLTFRGTIDLEQGGLLATDVSTQVSDMQPYLPKTLIGSAKLSGPLSLNTRLAGPFSDLAGTLHASGDCTVQGTKLSGAAVDATFSGRKWSVQSLSATLDDALMVNAAGKLTPSPDWQRLSLDLKRLTLSYAGQELSLTSPGGGTISSGRIAITSALAFAGPLGRFRLQSSKDGARQLALVAEDLSDTGLLRQLSGKDLGFRSLRFTLLVDNALSSPDWSWRGDVQGLTVQGEALTLDGSFDLAHDRQGLHLRQCRLANSDHAITLSGHLPLTIANRHWAFLPSPMQIKAAIVLPTGGIMPKLFPEWLAGSGEIQADLNLSGTWDQPMGQIQFSAAGLSPGPRLSALPPGPFDAKGLLQVERDTLKLDHLSVSSPELNLQLAGALSQVPLSSLLEAEANSLPGHLDVKGRYTLPALDWLATRVTGLRRTSGKASGSFAVRGPLSQPELQAEISIENGAARLSDSLLVFRDITLRASLNQQQLTISSLSGTMGGSQLAASGQVRAVFSETPELDLHLTGQDLLLYRTDGIKIRADTNLTLAGTSKAPTLSGEILLTDSRINKRVEWLSFLKPGTNHSSETGFTLFSFKDPPMKDTRLDLRIKAAKPMLVANNVFKGEVRPDLVLAGSGEVPYLNGVIYADKGRITLPSGRLDMENGLIRFTEEAPDRPQLEFQASGRMMAYDITAQIRGAYDEPEVTLSSVPPLASEDLLLLLLTGRRPVGPGQTNDGVSTVAVYLGRGLLARLSGERAEQLLLLDRLELDVGRAVTQQGEPTLDARVKLADDVWKVGTSYYITGEKDIWDYYNGGIRVVFHFR